MCYSSLIGCASGLLASGSGRLRFLKKANAHLYAEANALLHLKIKVTGFHTSKMEVGAKLPNISSWTKDTNNIKIPGIEVCADLKIVVLITQILSTIRKLNLKFPRNLSNT